VPELCVVTNHQDSQTESKYTLTELGPQQNNSAVITVGDDSSDGHEYQQRAELERHGEAESGGIVVG
jgi:hypothetical protein